MEDSLEELQKQIINPIIELMAKYKKLQIEDNHKQKLLELQKKYIKNLELMINKLKQNDL